MENDYSFIRLKMMNNVPFIEMNISNNIKECIVVTRIVTLMQT